MFCEKCGKKIEDSAVFCEGCGRETGVQLTRQPYKPIVPTVGQYDARISCMSQVKPSMLSREEYIVKNSEKAIGRIFWNIIWEIIKLLLYFFVIEPFIIKPILASILHIDINYNSISDMLESGVAQTMSDIGQHGVIIFLRIIWFVDAVITIGKVCIRQPRSYLYLTNLKIVGDNGNFFGNHTVNASFSEVIQIEVKQNPLKSLFRYGELIIKTTTGKYSFTIKDPHEFKHYIDMQIRSGVTY